MYLYYSWDKDDEFKQTAQIRSIALNQWLSDARLFGAPNTLHIDGFRGACSVVLNTTHYLNLGGPGRNRTRAEDV